MEKYIKDFDGWNNLKKTLNNKSRELSFCEKEIWWCGVGVNVGSEQDGKGSDYLRPVYILKKINSKTFIGIPLTSRMREDVSHVPFYFNYDFSTAVLSQVRICDKKRLCYRRIGIVSDYLHEKMKKAILTFFVS